MVVTCPMCGALSHDLEFCDRCNADLGPPAVAAPPRTCPLRPDRIVELTSQQITQLARPEAAVVLDTGQQKVRLHWIAREVWPMYRAGVERRCQVTCPVLPACQLIPVTTGFWIVAVASGRPACPWLPPAPEQGTKELRRMVDFLDRLGRSLQILREANLVWLSFDPRELEHDVYGQGLWITNLDLAVSALGQNPAQVRLNPRYAAPELFAANGGAVGPALDVYHLAIYGYYWLARLLPDGFLGKGLEAFGHHIPPLRLFCPGLAPGIAPILARGLALDPKIRPAMPAALCGGLRTAIDGAERRVAQVSQLHWQIGGHTRTGRAKQVLGRSNEDAILIRSFDKPARAFAAVADGISTCDVGSGGIASFLTGLALDNAFNAQCSAVDFERCMTSACYRAAENLLSWAKEQGKEKRLLEGGDLMGTTLTAVWLEDRHLQVANLGDSRVYLLGKHFLEQLTVDGDLGGSLLAAGAPPEHVAELGGMAHALRDCVGGCDSTPDGQLKVAEEHNRPTFSRWSLQPGDVVVMCSDGLVEEGLFLEPATMERLLRDHADRPAQELAELLADAADSLQRLPSPLEPDGTGDNISCIVIKISGPED
jgi:serine/threonine protein phosphatase PrpC